MGVLPRIGEDIKIISSNDPFFGNGRTLLCRRIEDRDAKIPIESNDRIVIRLLLFSGVCIWSLPALAQPVCRPAIEHEMANLGWGSFDHPIAGINVNLSTGFASQSLVSNPAYDPNR
jgi:hypothetical protein